MNHCVENHNFAKVGLAAVVVVGHGPGQKFSSHNSPRRPGGISATASVKGIKENLAQPILLNDMGVQRCPQSLPVERLGATGIANGVSGSAQGTVCLSKFGPAHT